MANTKRWSEVITPVTQYKNGLATPEMLEKLDDVALKLTDILDRLTSLEADYQDALNLI